MPEIDQSLEQVIWRVVPVRRAGGGAPGGVAYAVFDGFQRALLRQAAGDDGGAAADPAGRGRGPESMIVRR